MHCYRDVGLFAIVTLLAMSSVQAQWRDTPEATHGAFGTEVPGTFVKDAYSIFGYPCITRRSGQVERAQAGQFGAKAVVFVIPDSAIGGEVPPTKELSQFVSVAQAVKNARPIAPIRALIDNAFDYKQRLELRSASAVNLGDLGFIWEVTWLLFPHFGGSSGIPFEYRAVVRSDGSVVRPRVILFDHCVLDDRFEINSTIAIDQISVASVQKVSLKDVRGAADSALSALLMKNKCATRLPVVSQIERYTTSGLLRSEEPVSQELEFWGVHYTAGGEDDVPPVLTIWVANDLSTSQLSLVRRGDIREEVEPIESGTLSDQPESQQSAVREILRLGGDWEAGSKTVLIGYLGENFTNDKFLLLKPLTDLRLLYFQDVPADDSAFEHCAALNQVKQLQMDSCEFTGAGLIHFANSKSLERIIIEDTPITDDGLASIAKLTSLRSVSIANYNVQPTISAKGIRALRTLKNLKQLSVTMDSVPDGLKAKMERLLPCCEVDLNQFGW